MGPHNANWLQAISEIIRRFDLNPLTSTLEACTELARDDALLDVAVLGQFKSGKSSLLNAILGSDVFPVGVLPVTAVITRAHSGDALALNVRYLNGVVEQVDPARLAEFVSERGNPDNRLGLAAVDVVTPALRDWPGVRLVDTPGLGSIFAHNTATTKGWLPHVAVALVVVSVERPLSDEDRRLLDEAHKYAGKVFVLLTKVDLVSAAEQQEIAAFLDRTLREIYAKFMPVLPFSTRVNCASWLQGLKQAVFEPLTRDFAQQRQASLAHKCRYLVDSCRSYLEVGWQAAQRADADRDRLRAAVLDESVHAAVIDDELRLAERRICEQTRPAFETLLLGQRTVLASRLIERLTAEYPTWRGNLADRTQRFERWMSDQLLAALTPLSEDVAEGAVDLLGQAEARFRRIVEAFRDRLGKNIRTAMSVTVSPAAWEAQRPRLTAIPVRVGATFMTNWELLSWLLPMRLVGGLLLRHLLKLVRWEVEKNSIRLGGDWSAAVNAAVAHLRDQAAGWVLAELDTFERMLAQKPAAATDFREALESLERIRMPRPFEQPGFAAE